eukprot:6790984-Heterocapsa_arctica.AAC.1
MQTVVDYQVLKYYDEGGVRAKARYTFLSFLPTSHRMVVKHLQYGGKWFWPMANYSGMAVLGWPVDIVPIGGNQVCSFVPLKKVDDLQWLVVDDLKGWRAMPMAWLSPRHLELLGVTGIDAIRAVPAGD